MEFLLTEDLLRLLASSDEVRHHFLSWAVWKILVNFKVFLCQLVGKLVGECLQLAETDSVVCVALLSDLLLGKLNGRLVVGRNEHHAVCRNVVDGHLHAVVVASVGFLDAVPNWTFKAVLLGKLSFFIHVSTSHKFETEVIPQHLRCGNLVLDDLAHPLQVALVPIHYNVFVSDVELVRELLTK